MSNRNHRRNKVPPFAWIDNEVMQSAAWKKLNGGAVKIYVFMRSKTYCQLNKAVKSTFKLSYERIMDITGLSRQTVRNGILELENLGFIDFVKQGGLKSGGLSANEYAISQRFLKYDSPLFERGQEMKQKSYPDRGFSKVWMQKKTEKQKTSIKNRPAQSNFYTSPMS
jgi:hypothetical protein